MRATAISTGITNTMPRDSPPLAPIGIPLGASKRQRPRHAARAGGINYIPAAHQQLAQRRQRQRRSGKEITCSSTSGNGNDAYFMSRALGVMQGGIYLGGSPIEDFRTVLVDPKHEYSCNLVGDST